MNQPDIKDIKISIPKIGDEIYFDTQPGKIEIIQIEENYIRDDLEQELHEIELEFEKLKKHADSIQEGEVLDILKCDVSNY